VADGHDHVFASDQVFVVEIGRMIGNLGATRRTKFFADRFQFLADDGTDANDRAQNIEIVLDLRAKPVELIADFIAAKRGETSQAQFENGAGLLFRKVERAIVIDPVTRLPASAASSTARAPSPDRAPYE
jgi:hypothetical protein